MRPKKILLGSSVALLFSGAFSLVIAIVLGTLHPSAVFCAPFGPGLCAIGDNDFLYNQLINSLKVLGLFFLAASAVAFLTFMFGGKSVHEGLVPLRATHSKV